jgi:hypothetical protein
MNHFQAFRKPGILWRFDRSGPRHLFELDPLLAILIREVLRNFYVAFALVVFRQSADVSVSDLKPVSK